MSLWQTLRSYVLILGGTGARMGGAFVYFLLLVNLLSLEDYGIFVSVLASALIISNGGTYGFLAPTFRAQTEQSSDCAAYFGGLLLYALAWVPLTLLAGVAIHAFIFSSYVSLQMVMVILVSEAILMRLLDSIYDLNVARNRYGHAALINFLSVLPRVLAVLLFMLAVDRSLENWALYFMGANLASFLCALVLMPRIRPVFSLLVLRQGLKEAFSQEGVNFIQSLQVELDKVLVLLFAGPAAAGIYSLSMRIIYVVNEPVRSLFPLVAKFFIKDIRRIRSLRNQVLFEGGMMLSCLAAYASLLVLLSLRPGLLGENVEAGFAFFSLLPMVFATKLLPEYHKTVLYGAKRLHKAVVVAFSITVTKTVAMWALASQLTFAEAWILPLNLLYLVLYGQSLWATWGWAMREPGKGDPAEPSHAREMDA